MQPKSFLTSRTFWFNFVTFLVAVLGLLQGQEWIASNPQAVAIIGMVAGVSNIVLRWLTSKPVVVVGFRSRPKRKHPRDGWQ